MPKIKLNGNQTIKVDQSKAEKLIKLKKSGNPGEMVKIGNSLRELRSIREIDFEDENTQKFYPINLEKEIYYKAKAIYNLKKDINKDYKEYKPRFENEKTFTKNWIREEVKKSFFERIKRIGGVYVG